MKTLLKHAYALCRAVLHAARMCKVLLVDQRYFASVSREGYRDRAGGYLPWLTYPAIEAIKNWDLSDRRVFEYGSGFSTLFWAERAKEVISVEHDPTWHERISKLAPANTTIVLSPIAQGAEEEPGPAITAQFRQYAETIVAHGTFDLIVLDGYARSRMRYRCARAALPQLSRTGLIVLDNSDWLPATAWFLRQAGLLEVDLSGPVPGTLFCQTTSFFFARGFNFAARGARQPLPPIGGRIDNWEEALEQELIAESVPADSTHS